MAAAEGDSSESRSTSSSTSSGASTTLTTQAGTVRPVGGIGARAPVPLLHHVMFMVTDANYLRNLYVEVGATYEGENATTVLPPPPPEAPGMLVG